MRVLVVGAGLGGLTAAMRLQENGAEVTVFEARDRAGGRVWSHRFDNGTVVELGGEWIDSTQNAVTDLAADLGLSMFDTRQDFVTRDLIGSEPIPDEEHANLARRVVAAMEGLGNERLETMSIAALLDSLQVTSPAMAVLRSRLEGTMGVPLTEISAADLGEEFGLTQASTYLRVQGGNDRLAREMASRLDVRLGTPVHAVGQGETSASVTTDEANVAADHVVVAVPLPILRRPGFLDSPPPAFRGAIDGIGMGTAVNRASATTNLSQRGLSFEIPGEQVDGMDVRAVKAAGDAAVSWCRAGKGPIILEMLTYRYRGHSMSDPAKYRSKEEVDRMRTEHDPIEQVRSRMLTRGLVSEDDLKRIDGEVRAIVNEAAEFATNDAEPDAAELWTDVYAG